MKSEACKLKRWQLIHIFSTGQHPSCIHIKSSLNASWLQPGGVSDEEHIWNRAWNVGAARRDRGGSYAHITSITTSAWAPVAPWISDGNSIPRVMQSGVTVAFCHPSDRHPSLRNLNIFCQKPSATVRETRSGRSELQHFHFQNAGLRGKTEGWREQKVKVILLLVKCKYLKIAFNEMKIN